MNRFYIFRLRSRACALFAQSTQMLQFSGLNLSKEGSRLRLTVCLHLLSKLPIALRGFLFSQYRKVEKLADGQLRQLLFLHPVFPSFSLVTDICQPEVIVRHGG